MLEYFHKLLILGFKTREEKGSTASIQPPNLNCSRIRLSLSLLFGFPPHLNQRPPSAHPPTFRRPLAPLRDEN